MEKDSENNMRPDNENPHLSNYSVEIQTDPNGLILSNAPDSENNDESPIPVRILLGYNTMGFKIVPLAADSKTPLVKSTNEIYANPSLWTSKKIEQESYKFKNVATTLGKTNIKFENEDLYLNVLDIDSDRVLAILFDTLEELKSKTYVTKTKKDCGYHVYWLSYKWNPPVRTAKCRPGYEFEIKTDNSLGLCTLPPSRHRSDPSFRYYCVGIQNRIIIEETLYNRLLDLLKGKCLVTFDSSGNNYDNNGKTTKSDLDSVYRILQEEKIEQLVSDIKENYQKGSRHDLVFGLSGLLFKNRISLPSAKSLISLLCDFTHDEEKASRLDVVSDTYSKGLNGNEIKGTTQLQEVLLRIHGKTEIVEKILGKITRILLADDLSNTHRDNDTHPSSTQILTVAVMSALSISNHLIS